MRGGKTFSDLAASSHRNLSIVFKDWSIRYNTPGGMKEVVKTAQVTETAKNLLESIKPGEQMVLDITEEMGCNFPIVRTATVEADLNCHSIRPPYRIPAHVGAEICACPIEE